MLIWVDKRVGFREAIDDGAYGFSWAIAKIFEKNLTFYVKHCSRGKVQYLVFSDFLLQLWTKYLRQILVFMWNSAVQGNSNFFISAVFW